MASITLFKYLHNKGNVRLPTTIEGYFIRTVGALVSIGFKSHTGGRYSKGVPTVISKDSIV